MSHRVSVATWYGLFQRASVSMSSLSVLLGKWAMNIKSMLIHVQEWRESLNAKSASTSGSFWLEDLLLLHTQASFAGSCPSCVINMHINMGLTHCMKKCLLQPVSLTCNFWHKKWEFPEEGGERWGLWMCLLQRPYDNIWSVFPTVQGQPYYQSRGQSLDNNSVFAFVWVLAGETVSRGRCAGPFGLSQIAWRTKRNSLFGHTSCKYRKSAKIFLVQLALRQKGIYRVRL